MPRPAPQSHDTGSTRGPTVYNTVPTTMSQGAGERSITSGAVPVADIVRKLDFASNENLKLRGVLHHNNELLESKLQEIEHCLESSKSESNHCVCVCVCCHVELSFSPELKDENKAFKLQIKRECFNAHNLLEFVL